MASMKERGQGFSRRTGTKSKPEDSRTYPDDERKKSNRKFKNPKDKKGSEKNKKGKKPTCWEKLKDSCKKKKKKPDDNKTSTESDVLSSRDEEEMWPEEKEPYMGKPSKNESKGDSMRKLGSKRDEYEDEQDPRIFNKSKQNDTFPEDKYTKSPEDTDEYMRGRDPNRETQSRRTSLGSTDGRSGYKRPSQLSKSEAQSYQATPTDTDEDMAGRETKNLKPQSRRTSAESTDGQNGNRKGRSSIPKLGNEAGQPRYSQSIPSRSAVSGTPKSYADERRANNRGEVMRGCGESCRGFKQSRRESDPMKNKQGRNSEVSVGEKTRRDAPQEEDDNENTSRSGNDKRSEFDSGGPRSVDNRRARRKSDIDNQVQENPRDCDMSCPFVSEQLQDTDDGQGKDAPQDETDQCEQTCPNNAPNINEQQASCYPTRPDGYPSRGEYRRSAPNNGQEPQAQPKQIVCPYYQEYPSETPAVEQPQPMTNIPACAAPAPVQPTQPPAGYTSAQQNYRGPPNPVNPYAPAPCTNAPPVQTNYPPCAHGPPPKSYGPPNRGGSSRRSSRNTDMNYSRRSSNQSQRG